MKKDELIEFLEDAIMDLNDNIEPVIVVNNIMGFFDTKFNLTKEKKENVLVLSAGELQHFADQSAELFDMDNIGGEE